MVSFPRNYSVTSFTQSNKFLSKLYFINCLQSFFIFKQLLSNEKYRFILVEMPNYYLCVKKKRKMISSDFFFFFFWNREKNHLRIDGSNLRMIIFRNLFMCIPQKRKSLLRVAKDGKKSSRFNESAIGEIRDTYRYPTNHDSRYSACAAFILLGQPSYRTTFGDYSSALRCL